MVKKVCGHARQTIRIEMKVVLFIAFILSTGLSFSQEWRDSLEVARREYKNENYEEALKYYKSAQSKAPDNIDLSDEIGQSAYKSGDYATAEKIYQQNGGNKTTNKTKAENYHNIGNSRMRSENYQGAVDAYKDALRLNPKDEQTRYNLSEAQRKLKKKQKQSGGGGGGGENKQPPKDNEGQGDPQQGNEGDEKNGGKPQEGDSKGQQPQGQKKGSGNQSKNSNKSQLPNKTVDRMLDELMKNEAETKRKMAGNGGGGFSPKSGKDW